MTISATPGSTCACTLQLPQQAQGNVSWLVQDPRGRTIADGRQPPTGTLVAVAFVMPTEAYVPLDGSEYAITATDGVSSVREGLRVISQVDPGAEHNGEVAYGAGTPFTDTLVVDVPFASLSAVVQHVDGTLLANVAVDTTNPVRLGDAFLYQLQAGILDTKTATTYGIGTVAWSGVRQDGVPWGPDYHGFWTITPYSATYVAAIRKLVDRARLGDANHYLDAHPVDLANAVVRGMEYVIQSMPTSTPFALDQIPLSLRDYVIKAGALDFLRSQYLAEGMSAFDLQNPGSQLQVDRSQYFDQLVSQLTQDLQTLPQAKNLWMQQGMPMGGALVPGKRPIGVLGLTVGGTYNNFSVEPLFYGLGGDYSFLGAQKRRYQMESLQLTGTLAASRGAPGGPNPGLEEIEAERASGQELQT